MKWIRTALCALGMLACLSLSAFAAELGEPNITTKTTMKELLGNVCRELCAPSFLAAIALMGIVTIAASYA